jgi:hypothetical protein
MISEKTPPMEPMVADEFFPAVQRDRLAQLMLRWRAARDAGIALRPDEQAELEALAQAEVTAAGQRAGALFQQVRT